MKSIASVVGYGLLRSVHQSYMSVCLSDKSHYDYDHDCLGMVIVGHVVHEICVFKAWRKLIGCC